MKKMLFEEPEMEVVRFDPRDAFIATSTPFEKEEEEMPEDEENPEDEE